MNDIIIFFLAMGTASWAIWSVFWVANNITIRRKRRVYYQFPEGDLGKTKFSKVTWWKEITRKLLVNPLLMPQHIDPRTTGYMCDRKPLERTSGPLNRKETLTAQPSDQIFLCRKIKFGKNGNFIRYHEIANTGYNLKQFMTQFDGVKLRKFD